MRKAYTTPIITGLMYSFAFVAVGSIITAFLLQYTSLSESILPLLTYSVNFISLLAGGIVAGRKAQERGWYIGGLTGLFYAAIIFIIAFLALDAEFSMRTLVSMIGAFSSAAIGGIIGVNFAK